MTVAGYPGEQQRDSPPFEGLSKERSLRHKKEAAKPPYSGVRTIENVLIIAAARDCFFENRRVGCHAAQSVFNNQAPKLAAREQAAPDVVEPNGLAVIQKMFQWVCRCLAGHGFTSLGLLTF
jgi:hypothetical protein